MKKFLIILILSFSCSKEDSESVVIENPSSNVFYYGADLSYVNEMEDCGAVYRDSNENIKSPYKIFADSANNIFNENALITGYPATEQGQLNYLNDLKTKIFQSGGEGIVYWEPAWVSTSCSTLWATGSHWDNATLFNHNNKSNLGMQFYNASKN